MGNASQASRRAQITKRETSVEDPWANVWITREPLSSQAARCLALKKKPTARQTVEWIFENLGGPAHVNPLHCPSLGAWALFCHIVNTNQGHWFYETMYKGLMPSRAQVDMEAQFSDDGRSLADFAKSIADAPEVSVFEYRPEGLSEKPPLQREAAQGGGAGYGIPASPLDDVPA